jgi:hypothetical protein
MAYNDAFHFVGIGLAVSMLAVLLTRKLPEGLKAGSALSYSRCLRGHRGGCSFAIQGRPTSYFSW